MKVMAINHSKSYMSQEEITCVLETLRGVATVDGRKLLRHFETKANHGLLGLDVGESSHSRVS